MRPSEIQRQVALALCDERTSVIEEKGTGDFNAVDEFIKGEYKDRFFERVLTRIQQVDDDLRLHAEWARNLHAEVAGTHIRLDCLEVFLISLNYFLGQQKDLRYNRTNFCHKQPDAPEYAPSDFYIFLDNLPKEG